ncbi:MAG: hypothetical protein LBT84_00030 [Spirochaetia bacterium]|nr:hypothetical protein [Spirochaetia bacterium]
MRDDIAVIVDKLRVLYSGKNAFLIKIAEHYSAQESLLRAENFEAMNDLMDENAALISAIDSLDYDISAQMDGLIRRTGMDKKMLDRFLNESREGEALRTAKTECAESIEAVIALADSFIGLMKSMTVNYLKDADELARIRRMKELL